MSSAAFLHEPWINTWSLTIRWNHTDERSIWKEKKLDTKEPKGDPSILFNLSSLFGNPPPPPLARSLSGQESHRKQNSLVYIIWKITGGCSTLQPGPLDLQLMKRVRLWGVSSDKWSLRNTITGCSRDFQMTRYLGFFLITWINIKVNGQSSSKN